jgi:hypothetical protein
LDLDHDGDLDQLDYSSVVFWDKGLPLSERPLPFLYGDFSLAAMPDSGESLILRSAEDGLRLLPYQPRPPSGNGFRVLANRAGFLISGFAYDAPATYDLYLLTYDPRAERLYAFDGSRWSEALTPIGRDITLRPNGPVIAPVEYVTPPQDTEDYYLVYVDLSSGRIQWSTRSQ